MFSNSTRFVVALLRVLRNLGLLYLLGWYVGLSKAPSAVIQFVAVSTLFAAILIWRAKRSDLDRGTMLLEAWLGVLGFRGEWLLVSPSWSDDIPKPRFLEESAKRILEAALSMEVKVALWSVGNPLCEDGRVLILLAKPVGEIDERQLRRLGNAMQQAVSFNFKRLSDWVQTVRFIRSHLSTAGR